MMAAPSMRIGAGFMNPMGGMSGLIFFWVGLGWVVVVVVGWGGGWGVIGEGGGGGDDGGWDCVTSSFRSLRSADTHFQLPHLSLNH